MILSSFPSQIFSQNKKYVSRCMCLVTRHWNLNALKDLIADKY